MPKQPEPPPTVTIVDKPARGLTADYEWNVYRFLLGDGRTVDVLAIRDDSELRRVLLTFTGAPSINGVVMVPPTPDGDDG